MYLPEGLENTPFKSKTSLSVNSITISTLLIEPHCYPASLSFIRLSEPEHKVPLCEVYFLLRFVIQSFSVLASKGVFFHETLVDFAIQAMSAKFGKTLKI